MSDTVKVVTDANFNAEVLQASLPVLVDFWAEWCGPCKMIAPIVAELSKDFAGKVVVAKMNVDENPKVPADHNIRGIPTLILFKDGKVAAQKVGAASRTQLTDWLNSQI